MVKKLALAAVMALAMGGVSQAQGIDPVLTRQAGMSLLSGTFGGARAVAAAKGDVKTLESAGKAIEKWGAVVPALFPAGSDKGATKAGPAIWSDAAGFKKASMALSAAGETLAVAAKAGDADAVAAAIKGVGTACGGCHNTYRLK